MLATYAGWGMRIGVVPAGMVRGREVGQSPPGGARWNPMPLDNAPLEATGRAWSVWAHHRACLIRAWGGASLWGDVESRGGPTTGSATLSGANALE
jgi:hypothetical protein